MRCHFCMVLVCMCRQIYLQLLSVLTRVVLAAPLQRHMHGFMRQMANVFSKKQRKPMKVRWSTVLTFLNGGCFLAGWMWGRKTCSFSAADTFNILSDMQNHADSELTKIGSHQSEMIWGTTQTSRCSSVWQQKDVVLNWTLHSLHWWRGRKGSWSHLQEGSDRQ